MNIKNFDWTKFSHLVIIRAELTHIFKHLATAEGLEQWFLGQVRFSDKKNYAYCNKGDAYFWKWATKDFKISGQVLEVSLNKSVKYTFGAHQEIEFSIKQKTGSNCEITLVQHSFEGSSQFDHLNCCVCWVFFLTNLKSWLENKIDLREKEFENEFYINQ